MVTIFFRYRLIIAIILAVFVASTSNASGQDCVPYDVYINRTPTMGNFDEIICDPSQSSYIPSSYPPADDQNLSQFDEPSNNSYEPFRSVRLPPGVSISYDLNALKGQLESGQVIIHLDYADKPGQPAYAIVSQSDVRAYENYYSAVISTENNMLSDSGSTILRIVGNALAETGISNYLHNWAMQDLPEFIQANGSNYDSYNNVMNYASSLQGLSEANIANIYDKVQQTITQNNTDANSYSMAQSLESGIGVCRHGATVLATALADSGYDSSMVFNANHAWVRVNLNGSSFDLDPNGYESFVKLQPRNTSSDYQILPIKPTNRPGGFLWPLFPIAHASTDTTLPQTTKRFCGKIGICLDIRLPAYIQANSSSTLEIWQANDNDWSIVTFFKNPDIKMDFSKVKPTAVNIFGQNREAKEHIIQSNGKTTYALYSNFNNSKGEQIILQALSNKSILANELLMTMISGNNNVIKSPQILDSIYRTMIQIWPLLLIVAILILGIIFSVFMITRHTRNSQDIGVQSEVVTHKKNKIILWYILTIILIGILIYIIGFLKIYNWQGTWNTTYDEMRLAQEGLNVSGPYGYRHGNIEGYISGFYPLGTFGSNFDGLWKERIDNGNANTEVGGNVHLKISDDANSFSGTWNYASTSNSVKAWIGSRQSKDAPYIRGYQLLLKFIFGYDYR